MGPEIFWLPRSAPRGPSSCSAPSWWTSSGRTSRGRDANFQQTLQAKIDNSRATATKTTNARQSAKSKGSERTPNQQRSPPAKSNETLSVYWIFGILVLIVGLGAGSMIALEHFQKLS